MILSGSKIKTCVKQGTIDISPFNNSQINPNSYNYRLGDYLKVYEENILDPKKKLKTKKIKIPEEGLILYPNKLYLGYTEEIFGSDKYVPIITGRSSTGRLGLFVQITSDLVDIGFHGRLTLQLHATQPVKIYPRMLIGQVMFWRIYGKIKLYEGKYQNSTGPRETEVWRDFKNA